MIVYVYDIFGKDLKEYNRVKRRFYYELRKILDGNAQINWKTKSMLTAPEREEVILDSFFKKYSSWIIVYKFKPQTITQIT
ncbi:MAG: hypothetical protein ACPL06_02790 [Candidatus Anstonellales archaeon]